MILFSQLEEIVGGKNISFSEDGPVLVLSIDSRKASSQKGTVFFAIQGDRHDGHRYLHDLYRKGVRQFVVERPIEKPEVLSGCNIIQVKSSVDALQKLAAFHRSKFSIPIIGVTGSNGKTIIKEWLYQLLSKDRVVVKNPGSYNSQVGVPLSVWQLQAHHQIGIFEAGVSRPGEMGKLSKVIQPTLGIDRKSTRLNSSHVEISYAVFCLKK